MSQAAQKAGAIKSIKAMILIDMIGDRDLQIKRDSNSTPWLNDIIWAAAKRVGHGATFPDLGTRSKTTTCRSSAAGVPSVDIIDLDYAAWHTGQRRPAGRLRDAASRSSGTLSSPRCRNRKAAANKTPRSFNDR